MTFVVVDSDSELFTDALMGDEFFMNTYRVRSPSGGMHFYFKIKGFKTKRFDEKNERICDILGIGSQVLGPNSIIADRKYEEQNQFSIKETTETELMQKIYKAYPGIKNVEEEISPENVSEKTRARFECDASIAYIKAKLTVVDILKDCGIIASLNTGNTRCPFHSSKNGRCFAFGAHWYHCFHCHRHGSMIDLYMELNGISFSEAKQTLCERVGVPRELVEKSLEMIKTENKNRAIEFLVKKFANVNTLAAIRDDRNQEIWIYRGGIYEPHGKTVVQSFCRTALRHYYSSRIAEQVADRLVADSFVNAQDFFTEGSASSEVEDDNMAINKWCSECKNERIKGIYT